MTATARDKPLEASLAGALDVIAWEIELAGARCIQLDTLIGAMLNTLSPENQAQALEGLHTVDLLSQHLTGISAFARELGEGVSPELEARVDEALSKVSLGALADRLTTALGGVERGLNDGADCGDLDLF